MNGMIVKYSLCPKYFEEGEAYQIRVGTNDYRKGILVNYSEEAVTFKIFKGESMIDFTITIEQLRFRNGYELVKMKPDYEKGKFASDMD